MLKLHEPLARVIITCDVVGEHQAQVCVVEDATSQEILDACNKQFPRFGNWKRVIWSAARCMQYPDRVHYLVEC